MDAAHNNGIASDRLSFGSYFLDLTRILGSPASFFSDLPCETGYRQPLGFLFISSLFLAGASQTVMQEPSMLMALILVANTLVMTGITAGLGFMVMTMSLGRQVSFARMFAVYAYSAGVTSLASWIPLFVWITEPWKWLLITLGLVRGCGLKWLHAFLIIVCSATALVLFFYTLVPVIVYLRGLAGITN